jgi:hypothetical protein
MSNPTITPGYGYVTCSHDDPKRSHVFIDCTKSWSVPCYVKCDDCAKLPARKPVEIPDGWELVPEGEPVPADHQWISTGTYRWSHCGYGYKTFAKAMEDTYGPIPMGAFIRRKPAQPTFEPPKPAVDWSKPLQIKDGRKARFLALIECPDRPRCCVVTDADGSEWVEAWCENGNYTVPGLSHLGIINSPERIKREVWVNVYMDHGQTIPRFVTFNSKERADEIGGNFASGNRIACVRVQIDCEKGEGL